MTLSSPCTSDEWAINHTSGTRLGLILLGFARKLKVRALQEHKIILLRHGAEAVKRCYSTESQIIYIDFQPTHDIENWSFSSVEIIRLLFYFTCNFVSRTKLIVVNVKNSRFLFLFFFFFVCSCFPRENDICAQQLHGREINAFLISSR